MRIYFSLIVALALAFLTAPPIALAQAAPFLVGSTQFYVVDDATTLTPEIVSVDKVKPIPTATLAPLDAKIGSFTANAASGIIAAALTKRGLFAHVDYPKFWSDCNAELNATTLDLARSVQLHWIVTDVSNAVQHNAFIGTSWTNLAIAWSVYDCHGTAISPNGTQSAWTSSIYHKYAWRIPLDQIMTLVQLTNVLHSNAIHAPLIAGFSTGAGAFNTYLNQANPQDQILERTFLSAAERLASDFCGRPFPALPSGLNCWATPRI